MRIPSLACGLGLSSLLIGFQAILGQEPVDYVIDPAQRFQTIRGFGTGTIQWNRTVEELYRDPDFVDLFVNDLGATIVRHEIWPGMEPEVVEDWRDIDHRHWTLGVDHLDPAAALGFSQAVYLANPTEVKLIGSVWSPPGWMKKSGRTRGAEVAPEDNVLLDRYYPHFARYLAEWTHWFEASYGAPLYAIGPQNELRFSQPYNSCVYTEEGFVRLIMEVGLRLEEQDLDVLLFGPEHMTHDFTVTANYVKAVMDDPSAEPYLGMVASHGYTDGVTADSNPNSATQLWNRIRDYGREFWMTETSGESTLWEDETYLEGGETRTRPGALNGIAGAMHNALVGGNASAYVHWQISDVASSSIYALMILRQKTKKYHAFKHFSRYIRPGYVRLLTAPTRDPVDLSAFIDPVSQALTSVLVNRTSQAQPVNLFFAHRSTLGALSGFRTSASEDFVPIAAPAVAGNRAELVLPALSVTTLIGSLTMAETATFNVLATELEVPGWGGTVYLPVDASHPDAGWYVTGGASWIGFPQGRLAVGSGLLGVAVGPNPSGRSRSSTFTVMGQSVRLTQAPFEAPPSVFPGPLGNKWRETLGFFNDSFFPFVYFWDLDHWIWVWQDGSATEDSFLFYDFRRAQWGWTSQAFYPWYYPLLPGSPDPIKLVPVDP